MLKTQLSFQCSFDLTGTDRNTFINDTASQEAVIAAFASGLNNTTADDVRIANITDLGVYRSKESHLRAGVRTSAVGIAVILEIRRILEDLGLTAEDGAALHEAMSAQAAAAVSSGVFSTRLASRLTEIGSSMLLTLQPQSFNVGEYTVLVLVVAVPPSPSLSPTQGAAPSPALNSIFTAAPSMSVAEGGGKAESRGLPLGATMAIIVVAALLALLVLWYFYMKYTKHVQRYVIFSCARHRF